MERAGNGEGQEESERESDFYARGLPDGRDGEAGDDEPWDEVDALRATLIAEPRRRPGDIAALMRKAEAVSRMIAAQDRLTPKKERRLKANAERLSAYFKDILSPDD